MSTNCLPKSSEFGRKAMLGYEQEKRKYTNKNSMIFRSYVFS